MKGTYIRCTCSAVPEPQEIWGLLGEVTNEFCMCWSAFDDVYVIEMVCPERWIDTRGWCVECHSISSYEFFGSCMVAAGGVCMRDGRCVPWTRSFDWSDPWRSYHTDAVDISHPGARGAADHFLDI